MGGGGAVYRDTDWFWTVIGQSGRMEWVLESEQAVFGFVLAPHDCDEFSITRTIEAGPCDPQTLVLTGEPGDTVWLWVGPQTLQVPAGVQQWQFDYRCDFIGLMPEALSAEPRSWGAVKSMYR